MEITMATVNDADDLCDMNTLFGNGATIDIIKKSLSENDSETVCIARAEGKPVGFAVAGS